MALVHVEMEDVEDENTASNDTDEEVPEIPDTLFETEISEEETEIKDDKGNVHKVMVPKIKVCPYSCIGCDKYRDHLDERQHQRIKDHIPDGRSFRDYGGYKPQTYSGVTVIEKKYVDSDEESIKPDIDPIMVG
jgi:hypothetical protein